MKKHIVFSVIATCLVLVEATDMYGGWFFNKKKPKIAANQNIELVNEKKNQEIFFSIIADEKLSEQEKLENIKKLWKNKQLEKNGISLFRYTMIKGDYPMIVEFLIKTNKADKKKILLYTGPYLHTAAFFGDIASLKKLINLGFDPKATNTDKQTALEFVTEVYNNPQTIRETWSRLFNAKMLDKRLTNLFLNEKDFDKYVNEVRNKQAQVIAYLKSISNAEVERINPVIKRRGKKDPLKKNLLNDDISKKIYKKSANNNLIKNSNL